MIPPTAPPNLPCDVTGSDTVITLTTQSANFPGSASEVPSTFNWGLDYHFPVGENIPNSDDSQLFDLGGSPEATSHTETVSVVLTTFSLQTATIPEPSTTFLLLTAAGLLFHRRSRVKNQ